LKKLEIPLDMDAPGDLRAGEDVLLYGYALTMRDAVLGRLEALVDAGEKPPFEVCGQLIFHAAPTPPAAGRATGAIGPTTSTRMDRFLGMLFELGVRATLGKGRRSEDARLLHEAYGAVYFASPGGIAALFGGMVESMTQVAWEDLGPEVVYRVKLAGLPALVAIDARGEDHLAKQYKIYKM